MTAKSRLLSTTALALTLASVAFQARAQITFDARSTYSYGSSGTVNVDQPSAGPSYSPASDIFPSAQDANGNSIFGHSFALTDGHIGSRSSGANTYAITSSAEFKDVFTAVQAGDYTFNFVIDTGNLQVSDPAGASGQQRAALSATITVNGARTPSFNYHSALNLDVPGGAPIFSETGAVLNPAGPSLQAGYGTYNWSPYFGTLDLGVYAAGASVSIDYVIGSSASGSTTFVPGSGGSGCLAAAGLQLAVGTCYGSYGSYGGTSGDAIARIGDPFAASGTDFSVSFTPLATAVPEPASLALVGAGLAALAINRRRRVG